MLKAVEADSGREVMPKRLIVNENDEGSTYERNKHNAVGRVNQPSEKCFRHSMFRQPVVAFHRSGLIEPEHVSQQLTFGHDFSFHQVLAGGQVVNGEDVAALVW